MAKHDEKKDKKRKRDLEREESNHRTTASNATYVDGHALDEIQYLEAKLILKPDRFTSVESFREFGKIVKRAEQFFITLQQEAESWLSLGTTKTGMVYRLKGNAPQSHE